MPRSDMTPEELRFGLRADWRVGLYLFAQAPDMLLLVQHQILHAALDRSLVAGALVHVGDLETARSRNVDCVGAGTCLSTDFVDAGGGEVLDQRRVRATEGIGSGVAGLDKAGDVAPRHLLILVMDTAEQARRGKAPEGLVDRVVADPRE